MTGHKELRFHAGSRSPTERGTFEGGMRRPIITYLHVANVPVQRTQRTNSFAAARVTRRAMRLLAKLLGHWLLLLIAI